MIPGVGPVTARALVSHFGSAAAVFAANTDRFRSLARNGASLAGHLRSKGILDAAARELEFVQKHRIRVLWFKEAGFPARLNRCHDGPVLLYVRGKADLNASRCLSVVGTRKATSLGTSQCRNLLKGLAARFPGLVIVSGLAYGIDITAHRAALELGLPTVAVLGHGMQTIYPRCHRDAAMKISKLGALVTDFDSSMGPERNNFLRRNRIIAGLSDATLVVESPVKGGALVTADIAFSYDRLVLAVPGRPEDERSGGCNRLIKNHVAALTESAGDVAHYLGWKGREPVNTAPSLFKSENPSWNRVLLALQDRQEATPEALCSLTGYPIREVLVILLQLELKGLVTCGPGNRYTLQAPA